MSLLAKSCASFAGSCLLALASCSDPGATSYTTTDLERGEVPSWEEFRASARQTNALGVEYFVVEGDIPIKTEADLQQYYERSFVLDQPKSAVKTCTADEGCTGDDVWVDGDQQHLEYCIDTAFGNTGNFSYSTVQDWAAQAMEGWEKAGNVDFTYDVGRDSDCTPTSSVPHTRFIKITPITSGSNCAFWPKSRNDCGYDGQTLVLNINSSTPFSGPVLLAHELGHILGFHHEYMRNDTPGGCSTGSMRNLTDYDSDSVMLSQWNVCSDRPSGELVTHLDGVGLRELYGAPPRWYSFLL